MAEYLVYQPWEDRFELHIGGVCRFLNRDEFEELAFEVQEAASNMQRLDDVKSVRRDAGRRGGEGSDCTG